MFRELTAPNKGSSGTGVKASVAHGKSGLSTLTVSIARSVLDEIEAEPRARFRILIGEGENAGYLKVCVHKDGQFEPAKSTRGDTCIFRLGALDGLPGRQKPRWCAWKIVNMGEEILITLPGWAHDGGHPAIPPARRPAPKAQVSGTDVTAGLMGDPAPAARHWTASGEEEESSGVT